MNNKAKTKYHYQAGRLVTEKNNPVSLDSLADKFCKFYHQKADAQIEYCFLDFLEQMKKQMIKDFADKNGIKLNDGEERYLLADLEETPYIHLLQTLYGVILPDGDNNNDGGDNVPNGPLNVSPEGKLIHLLN